MQSLVERLREQRRAAPDAVLTIANDRPWTRAEVDDRSTRAAIGLLDAGLMPGDRIAIHLTNGIDIVAAYYACFKAGLIAVPINTRLKAPEIEYVLRHSEARAYIGQPALFTEADAVSTHIPLRFLTGFDGHGLRRFEDLIAVDASSRPLPAVAIDAPAMVLYTSGTTARPKGVTHTGRTLATTAEAGAAAMLLAGDRAGVILPLVHMAAVTLFFGAAVAECVAVVVPFDPNGVMAAIERHHITVLLAMPALYRMLAEAQAAQPRDVSSLRACLVGGDSAPAALHEQCATILGVPLVEGYGLTEAVPIAFNGAVRRPGSLGQALPQIEWRLIDDQGREVPRGEVGQVTVRSGVVCAGYWNDSDATRDAIKDGWLHTGDLARQDADGFYWFAGRSKEIIIRGGSNVSPQEVEETLYQHPAVREVAVVGKPDERWGEVIVAFVAMKDGASIAPDDLIAFAKERIAAYKVPDAIFFEAALPKGPTGKVARRPLRERFL